MAIRQRLIRISQLLLYAATFVITIFTSNVIFKSVGAEGFATYSIIISISVAVRILWYNLITPVVARYYPQNENDSTHQYNTLVFASILTPVIFSLTILPTTIAISADHIPIISTISPLFVPGISLGLALGTNAVAAELENIAFHRIRASITQLIPPIGMLLAIMYLTPIGYEIPSAIIISSLAILALSFAQIAHSHPPPIGNLATLDARQRTEIYTTVRQMAAFAAPMAIWTGPALLMKVTDRWVAASALTTDDFALFALLIGLSQSAFSAFYSVINRVFVPEIFRDASTGGEAGIAAAHRRINHMIVAIITAGLSAFCLGLILGPYALHAVSDGEFSGNAVLFSVTLLASAAFSSADANLLHGHVKQNLRPYMLSKILPPIVYAVASILLIGPFQLWGMTLAYSIAALANVAMSLAATRRLKRS